MLNYRDTVSAISAMTDDRVSFINNTIHSDFGNASYCVPHHNYVATMETLG